MKKFWGLTIFWIFIIICAQEVYAQEIKQSSYSVSPPASYKYIRLLPRALGAIGTDCSQEGLLYLNSQPLLTLCQEEASTGKTKWYSISSLWQQNGDDIFLSPDLLTGNEFHVGIGTDTPLFGMSLDKDGGILATGALDYSTNLASNTGVLPVNKAYPVFLWNGEKGALITHNDILPLPIASYEDVAGFSSTVFGQQNNSQGRASFAAGYYGNTSAGYRSVILSGAFNIVNPLGNPAGMDDDGQEWKNANIFDTYPHARTTSVVMGGSFCGFVHSLLTFTGGGSGNGNNHGNRDYANILSCIVGGARNAIYDSITDNYVLNTLNDFNGKTVYLDGTRSFILAGNHNNLIDSKGCSFGGAGKNNTIHSSGRYNSILGGLLNTLNGTTQYTAIGIGVSTTLTDDAFSAMGSVYQGSLSGDYSTIINGVPRPDADGGDTLGTGTGHVITGDYNVIGGGASNKITGNFNSIPGGRENTITGDFGFIGSAREGTISADYGVILSGSPSNISETSSSEPASFALAANGGPGSNTVSGSYAAVFQRGTVSNDYSLLFNTDPAGDAANNGNRTFMFASQGTVPDTTDDAFIIFDGTGTRLPRVGIGKDNPQYTLDVNGTIQAETLVVGNQSGLGTKKGLFFDTSTSPWTIFRQNDLAETFPASQQVEAGDVLALDPDHPGKVTRSSCPYSTDVMGVASSSPAVVFKDNQLIALPDAGTQKTDNPAVALAGRVPIKVSTENGPIEPGDMLTASSLPGVAMKADDPARAQHAVVAKALQPFKNNDPKQTGMILAVIAVK